MFIMRSQNCKELSDQKEVAAAQRERERSC